MEGRSGQLDDALASWLLTVSIPVLIFVISFTYLSWFPKCKSSGNRHTAETDFDTTKIQVSKILIHPIKSCKGTSMQEARKWCIINARDNSVITARQFAKMVLIHPRIVRDPSSPNEGHLEVSFPEDSGCEAFSVPLNPREDELSHMQRVEVTLWGKKDIEGYICPSLDGRSPSTILSQYFGYSVHLVIKGPLPRKCPRTPRFPDLDAPSYFQDGFPLLILSEESVTAVQDKVRQMIGKQGVQEAWAQQELVVERFRPNIVIKGAGAPFVEDNITELAITSDREPADGALSAIYLVSKCTRCLMPNVDTVTGIRDNAVPYKAMITFRKGLDPARVNFPCLGCNGIFTREGVMRVGDQVHVRQIGFV
ncbi:hypothetical protein J3A83DRAFT_4358656 [Scleroderma citrinum]